MKRIAVVATEKEYADFLRDDIGKYLSRYGTFVSYSVSEIEAMEEMEEKFVIVSAFTVFQAVREKVKQDVEIMVLSYALSKRQMAMLKDVPKGSRALLVNFDHRSCMHTITFMYNAGFRDVDLVPYYGAGDYDHSIRVAITPNEGHLVPPDMETVIDIGESSVDMNTLYLIADKLGVYEEFALNEAFEAKKEYYYINSSMDKLMMETESMQDRMAALIQLMNEGVIVTDMSGKIYLSNQKAQKLLSFQGGVLNGLFIEDVLPEFEPKDTKEKLISAGGRNLIVSAVAIKTHGDVIGYLITMTEFEEAEEKQHKMRSKLNGNTLSARFSFDAIIGTSQQIRKSIEYASRIARTDSAVLITGGSGTGKEVFAQSIHNGSPRRRYNFVAVNCAAIPEHLLESEMFGYEEGSFTGARKGGKAGFFELAHKGTIFLDEIAEMPLQLQSKLLRVLEERKVRRVGSSKEIDVDVRLIAATNKDLYRMVEMGNFREDLYYRINVLPLELPGLKDRPEDILPLFHHFRKNLQAEFTLSEEAEKALLEHPWKGNVRELRNVAEYLASQGKSHIDAVDLPPVWKKESSPSREPLAGKEAGTDRNAAGAARAFLLREGRNLSLYRDVLQALEEAYLRGEKAGRGKLVVMLRQKRLDVSDGDVRFALRKLSDFGYVNPGRGRSGSSITPEGRQLLEQLKNDEQGL